MTRQLLIGQRKLGRSRFHSSLCLTLERTIPFQRGDITLLPPDDDARDAERGGDHTREEDQDFHRQSKEGSHVQRDQPSRNDGARGGLRQ
jgi:hypothetical protein